MLYTRALYNINYCDVVHVIKVALTLYAFAYVSIDIDRQILPESVLDIHIVSYVS